VEEIREQNFNNLKVLTELKGELMEIRGGSGSGDSASVTKSLKGGSWQSSLIIVLLVLILAILFFQDEDSCAKNN